VVAGYRRKRKAPKPIRGKKVSVFLLNTVRGGINLIPPACDKAHARGYNFCHCFFPALGGFCSACGGVPVKRVPTRGVKLGIRYYGKLERTSGGRYLEIIPSTPVSSVAGHRVLVT